MPIIQQKIEPDSVVFTDYWRGYNALDVSEFKHCRINHSKLFAKKQNHINGIRSPLLRGQVFGTKQKGI